MKLIQLVERNAPVLGAVLTALVYAFTMAPTISHTDSGELAAVCYTFGVAHPTGYPLFTMLGGLFARLPFGTVAFNLNLMGLLFTAGSVYFWGRTISLMFDHWKVKVGEKDAELAFRVRMARLTAILSGCLFLGLGQTFWAQSTSAEVYSLHAFLLTLNLFLLFRAFTEEANSSKNWLIFSLGLALLFSNHLTAIVFLPGIAWLFYRKFGFTPAGFKQLGLMVAVSLPLLVLLYAWLPIRASADVPYAWGNPSGWDQIWHHISGKQFSVWFFTGQKAFNKNLTEFFQRMPYEMGFGLLFILPGVVYSMRLRRDWAIFFLLCIVSNILWACNYAIKDLEPYFLLSLISLSFFVAIGMRWLWLRMRAVNMIRFVVLGVAAAGLIGFSVLNFKTVDQKNAWQYEDYARASLNSLPPNSIVISQAWDVFVSPSYYLQAVEGIRTDVDIFDFPMLQNRHWYPDHIRRNSPEVAQHMGETLERWEGTIQDFDLRQKTDLQALSSGFRAVLNKIYALSAQRPVYVSPEMKEMVMNPNGGAPLLPGLGLVPEQYFYRIIPQTDLQNYREAPLTMYPLRHNRGFGIPEDRNLLNMLHDIVETRIRYAQALGRTDQMTALQGLQAKLPVLPQEKR